MLGGFGVTLAIVAAVLRIINGADPSGVNEYALSTISVAATLPILGSLILRRYPRHVVGVFLVGCGTVAGTVSLCNEWLVIGEGSLPGSDWAAWLSSWLWLVTFLLLPTVLVVIFPTGRPLTPRWGFVLAFIVCVWVVDSAWMMTTPLDPAPEGWAALESPLPWTHSSERLEDVWWWWPIPLIAVFVLAVMALVRRLGLATGIERRQLIPFALAAFVQIMWLLADLSFGLSDGDVRLDAVVSLFMPVGAAIGMLRYQLLDVDRIVSRTLTFAFVTAGAGALYGLTLLAASAFYTTDSIWISALAVGLVAASVLPLWRWANDWAERLLFGERADPAGVIRRLGEQLEALAEPGAAPRVVVDTIATSMRLPWVAVVLDDGDTAERGTRRGTTTTFPIEAGDHHFGTLEVATRSDVEDLTSDERRLLTDLTHDLAAMLNAGRLTTDLQRARNELVRTREEERRRVRNDLHDGLGPQLAGIGLQLDITRSHLGADNSEALATLARAKSALGEAIDDIRRLVNGLRPPALDEVGLLSALQQQIAVLGGDGGDRMAIDLRGPEHLERLPAAVEVAAFRIVSEAVNNAVRHSGAARCTVHLTLGACLVAEIRDDGHGMDDTAARGIGLASMCQRAEELGGTVQIDTGAFGTVVTASLPLERTKVTT